MRAVEMSYLRGACGVNRWDGLSNASVYDRCGMRKRGCGMGHSIEGAFFREECVE